MGTLSGINQFVWKGVVRGAVVVAGTCLGVVSAWANETPPVIDQGDGPLLVTLDEDVKVLAKLARVPVAEPKDLLRGSQGSLFAT